ncbi:Flp family type IVb pilin [Chelativorans intermedius]|uniref:Flp family type IVb pilin n=1 Tax=Chelativorans intermedius TaxID=515947 RepID=A0ABV6DBJ2_9HYPH|nr:Flp family type IVb pilin [Chelativorans intermedius]MCT8998051.1 Flp family type IVb pilin [Chelativorans intermedius]
MFTRFLRSEKGSTAVEYALIAGVLVLAIIAGVAELGRYAGQTFERVAEDVTAATN